MQTENSNDILNNEGMPNIGSIVNQYQIEIEGWKRIITFIKDENVHLKNLLSGVVKDLDTDDIVLLERIEYFQNKFLDEDEIIKYLRDDISEQDKALIKDIYEDRLSLKTLEHQQIKLRKRLEISEQKFNTLKFEFNNYLGKNLY